MKSTWRNSRTALGFLGPNVAGFLIFTAVPVVVSLVMAFTNWNLSIGVPLRWIGLGNFAELVRTRQFWVYFVNTIYLMLGIPVSIAGSLFLALLLNEMKFMQGALGRWLHAGLALIACAVIAGAILVINGEWAGLAGGLIMILGIVYALGAMLGLVVFRTLYYLPSFTSGVA